MVAVTVPSLAAGEIGNRTVRELERASIRAFVDDSSAYLTGRVLDYGCGLSPYRDLVQGDYHGYDRESFPGNVSDADVGTEDIGAYESWDAILCNQVIQYVPRPRDLLVAFRFGLCPGGHLILTGPTNWAEVEPVDLHRYTLTGITKLVEDAGLEVLRADRRAQLELGGFVLSLGYGILARRP